MKWFEQIRVKRWFDVDRSTRRSRLMRSSQIRRLLSDRFLHFDPWFWITAGNLKKDTLSRPPLLLQPMIAQNITIVSLCLYSKMAANVASGSSVTSRPTVASFEAVNHSYWFIFIIEEKKIPVNYTWLSLVCDYSSSVYGGTMLNRTRLSNNWDVTIMLADSILSC